MTNMKKKDEPFYYKYKDAKEISRDNNAELVDRWTRVVKALNNILPDKYKNRKEWQSKTFMPQLKTVFNSFVAKMDKIMYPTKESFFDIIPNDTGDGDAERVGGNLKRLYVAIICRGGFWKKKKSLLKECAMIGGSLLQMAWNAEKKVIDFHWLSITNAFLDDSVIDDFKKSTFFGISYEQSIVDALEDIRYDDSAKKELLNFLGDDKLSKPNTNTDVGDENREYLRSVEFDGVTRNVNPIAKFTIDEFRIKYYDKATEKSKWKIINVLVDKNIILRCEDYEDGLNDIIYFPFNKMLYHLYGTGVIEDAIGLQETLNDMLNLIVDNVKIATFPMIIAEESVSSSMEDLILEPLKIIPVPDGTKDRMGLQPLAPPNYDGAIRFFGTLKEAIEETVGVTRESTGGTIRSSERTEGQAELRLNASDERIVSFLKEFEVDGNMDMLYGMFYMIQKYMNQDIVNEYLSYDIRERDFIEIDAEEGFEETATQIASGTEEEEVPALDIKEDLDGFKFDFRIGGIFSYADTLEKEDKLTKTLNEAENLSIGDQVINKKELFKTIVNIRQLPNSERIIITDTDVNNVEKADLLDIPAQSLEEQQGGVAPQEQFGLQDQLLEQSILEGEQNV